MPRRIYNLVEQIMRKIATLFRRTYRLPKNGVLVFLLIVCLGLTAVISDLIKINITDKETAQFVHDSQEELTAIQNIIENNALMLRGSKVFFDANYQMDAQQLRSIAEIFLKRFSELQALAWAPKVLLAERAQFVAQIQKQYPKFEIFDQLSEEGMQVAPPRPDYYPVTYIAPLTIGQQFIGVDLQYAKVTQAPIKKALEQKIMTASNKIGDNVIFFVPLSLRANDTKEGFIVGVYRIGDLLEKALCDKLKHPINIHVTDLTATAPDNFIYELRYNPNSNVGSNSKLAFDYKMQVIDREWLFHCVPYDNYYQKGRWLFWVVLLICLMTTFGVLFLINKFYFVLEQTKRLAHIDVITRLPDRHYFNETLKREIARAARSSQLLAILYLDIDIFKNINDTYGHHVGDLFLHKVAKRIKSNIRASDFVARLGGDEFVVILSGIRTAKEAELVAKKLVSRFHRPLAIDHKKIQATLSIGIAIFPEDGADNATLLKKADAAMYNIKRSGRNGYQRFVSVKPLSD